MFLRTRRIATAPQARNITKLRRQQIKRAKTFGSWTLVVVGAVGLWKTLDFLVEQWHETDEAAEKEKVVILGSGFAALSMVDALDPHLFDITVISPRNYFVYTPALGDAVSGHTDIESVIEPIRNFEKRTKAKFTFHEAECTAIHTSNNTVSCKGMTTGEKFDLKYDRLILAIGALNDTHNLKNLQHVNFLSSLNDVRRIRTKMEDSIEAACLPGVSQEEQKRLLNFVVVGGGPVARKVAQQMSEYLKERTSFLPQLAPYAQVSLVNYLDHIHNYYDHKISDFYRKRRIYRKSGVIDVDGKITQIHPKYLDLKDPNGVTTQLPFSVCVWANGGAAHPLTKTLASQFPETQANLTHLVVSRKLRVEGSENVYAIGDCSTMTMTGLSSKYQDLFEKTDLNNDGQLSFAEITKACQKLGTKYPGLLETLSKLDELFEAADINKDGTLELHEFKKFVALVDQNLTRFPATAAVAVQQGQYLAKQFNKGKHKESEEEKKEEGEEKEVSEKADLRNDDFFRYKHLGGYEYVAAETGLRKRGSKGEAIISGAGAQWMYENVYFSVVVGMGMRAHLTMSRVLRWFTGDRPTKY